MENDTKYIIVKFIKFIKDELNFQNPFKVKLTGVRDNDLRTYAYYNPQNGDVKVYCKNRGVADILRSIAHELIHHHQNETGQLNAPVQDVGGHIEDEANSVAGQLVKKFGYANPDSAIYEKTI